MLESYGDFGSHACKFQIKLQALIEHGMLFVVEGAVGKI